MVTFSHECLRSSIFELIRVVEFDLELGDDYFSLKIQLYKALDNDRLFRAKLWRDELFRIQSVFPETNSVPDHPPSDEFINIAWGGYHFASFKADNAEAALQIVLDYLENHLPKFSKANHNKV